MYLLNGVWFTVFTQQESEYKQLINTFIIC